jgi:hypothetical protein
LGWCPPGAGTRGLVRSARGRRNKWSPRRRLCSCTWQWQLAAPVMESADATRGSSVAAPTHAEGYALDAARRPLAPHVSYDRLRSLKVTVDAAIKVTLTFVTVQICKFYWLSEMEPTNRLLFVHSHKGNFSFSFSKFESLQKINFKSLLTQINQSKPCNISRSRYLNPPSL